MKLQALLIIVIWLFFSCATQLIAVESWFPDRFPDRPFPNNITNLRPIDEYIHNFTTNDINIARNMYLTLLAFIKEVINAGHENLARAQRMESLTVKRSAIIDGVLTIIESTEMTLPTTRWDYDLLEDVDFASICILWEFVLIHGHSELYNSLLGYWYYLTGELLGEYIDLDAVYYEFVQNHEHLLEPRTF